MKPQLYLPIDSLVTISDAASKIGCTTEELLRQAISRERFLYFALAPHSARLDSNEHQEPRLEANRRTSEVYFVILEQQYALQLLTIGQATITNHLSDEEPPYNWYFWALDEPQVISINRIYFPKVDLPEFLTNGITQQDEIPGKLPKVKIGRLAVEIAWKIEAQKKAATAAEVMKLLQKHAEDGTKADVLREKTINGVKWCTGKGKPKEYDVEACGKTLETWKKSRA